MAFPWTFYENFEDGTLGGFNSETDTGGALNFPHYTEIIGRGDPVPYRNAYSLCVDLADVSTSAYVQENEGFDIAADATLFVGFPLLVTDDLVMATGDEFTLFTLQSGAGTDESIIEIANNSGTIQIQASETGTPGPQSDLILGEWHFVELRAHIDAGGGNDGTLDFYLDGYQIGSQVTSLDQGAITQARLGCVSGIDAGTTTGRIYVPYIISDDARIFPEAKRYATDRDVGDNEYVFLGPGHLSLATIISTGSDNQAWIYDTDGRGETYTSGAIDRPRSDALIELDNTSVKSFSGPIYFSRGCYVEVAGTNPRLRLQSSTESDRPGIQGFALDDAHVKSWAVNG